MENPPSFVFANVHGNLLVKFEKETAEKKSFYQFDSAQKLSDLIYEHNNIEAERDFNDIAYRFDLNTIYTPVVSVEDGESSGV